MIEICRTARLLSNWFVSQHAGINIEILHEQGWSIGLTVAENASIIEANFVAVTVYCLQRSIVDDLFSALLVLIWLITSFRTDKDRVINWWLQVGIARGWLNLGIPDRLKLFGRFCLFHTVYEVICHTLFTLSPCTHGNLRLFSENVKAALQIFQGWLLRPISTLIKRNDRSVEELITAKTRRQAPKRHIFLITCRIATASMIARIRG